jgi:rhomboid family GlyGly-CTERM serine protease
VISIAIVVLVSALMLLPPAATQLLYFDTEAIVSGELWRLITGHFIHADSEHFFWNMVGLVVLSTLIERRSGRLLCSSFVLGIIFIDALLLSPLSTIEQYCGLSGVLNTLLAAIIYRLWLETRSRWIIVVAISCIAKIILEMSLQYSLISEISWPPYPAAHLVGFIAFPIALFAYNTGFNGSRL